MKTNVMKKPMPYMAADSATTLTQQPGRTPSHVQAHRPITSQMIDNPVKSLCMMPITTPKEVI